MALRSLVLKMKALPRRLPGSGAFAIATKTKPKDNPMAKIVAEYENACRYGSFEEFSRTLDRRMEEEFRPYQEKLNRQIWSLRGLTLLITVGGFGSIGYMRAHR